MARKGVVVLDFDAALDADGKKLRDGLSGVVQVGSTLWVANDETVTLERLTYKGSDAGGVHHYGDHARFSLGDYLRLPVPAPPDSKDVEEADLEGLDYRDGYLWLIGSHSLKRKKPEEGDSAEKNIKRLAKVSRDGNRCLLARIPLVEENGTYVLKDAAVIGGKKLAAAKLRGDDKESALTAALESDKHLQPFLTVPGKDNGLDFEGLAVAGARVFIGMRGPVLRGWAVILEIEPEEDADDTATLRLRNLGSGHSTYQKHFLQLNGLGIRDLCVRGDDLLILAGPTMDLDGPVTLFRWPGGAQAKSEDSVVFAGSLEVVVDVPYGEGSDKGTDHAEGITCFAAQGVADNSLLVVYDSSATGRKEGENGVAADLFST
ncbi:DUF3616 domain-containing protein [Geomonas sp. RF6]|uniref:DUF3616 domain-containing protein n=1 Tax=Geomonas sp. RF6 TaxID=2897342 RepID=UPI001E647C8A|nr:DUF3616 domain-containing protein [Geomonas sp. RF6]UFS71449.1 DUF3616 domain-containing protein [Geomonas sp. RF6]